jgi:hypothetical protein
VKECSVEGCFNSSAALGLCGKHYWRHVRHGDPLYVNPKKTYGSPIERFMTKIEMVTESGCWIWIGHIDSCGYGRFRFKRQSAGLAHRFAFKMKNPDVDIDGLEVCHKCDLPCCVNPDHLFVGTHKDNMNDRDAKGRVRSGEMSGVAKITDEQVREIRYDNRTTRQIAADYGVAGSHVSAIKRMKTRASA